MTRSGANIGTCARGEYFDAALGGATSIPAVWAHKSNTIRTYPVFGSSMCITLDGDAMGAVSCTVRAAHATFNARYGVHPSIDST